MHDAFNFNSFENSTSRNHAYIVLTPLNPTFLLKKVDCGYSLEPPRRGCSNKYPQFVLSRNMRTTGIFHLKVSFFGGKIFSIFKISCFHKGKCLCFLGQGN